MSKIQLPTEKTNTDMPSFLSSHFLPQNYNTIEDYKETWILLKNTQLQPKFSFPFKDIVIAFGQDDLGKFRIHSIHYPKSSYSMDSVRKIAKSTVACRYCLEGENVLFPSNISESYINPNPLKQSNDHNVNNGHEETNMFNKLKSTLKGEAMGGVVKPIRTVDNIAEAIGDTYSYLPKKFLWRSDSPISFTDFMVSGLLGSVYNNLIDMQPTAGGQMIGYGIGILAGPVMDLVGKIPFIKNWFQGEPAYLSKITKLTSISLFNQMLPSLIGGAKYDAGFLDQAIADVQGAIEGIMGGYGLRDTIGNLFDFGFGSYLPFITQDYEELVPDNGGMAKILL